MDASGSSMKGRNSGILVNEYSPQSGERMKKVVVVVMDALRKLDLTALKWALAHVVQRGDTLTLVGVLPWRCTLDKDISIWADIWVFNEKNLTRMKLERHWRSGKYRNTREIMELCEEYGAKPQVRLAMGCPLELILLDKIANQRAAWAVFDRHLKKYKDYYQEKIPCNIAIVMSNIETKILRTRSPFLSNSWIDRIQSPMPCSLAPEINIPTSFVHLCESPSSSELRSRCYDVLEEEVKKGIGGEGMKEREEEEIYFRSSIFFETPTTPIN